MLNTRSNPSEQACRRDAERLITAAQSSSPPQTWIKEVSICYYRAQSHTLFQLEGFSELPERWTLAQQLLIT